MARTKGSISKPIDWSKLEGMLLFDPSASACAYHLGVSRETLECRIKQEHGQTFSEYKQKFVDLTVMKLKTTMINKALKGDNCSLIFCLKNMSEWADKTNVNVDNKDNKVFKLKYSNED